MEPTKQALHAYIKGKYLRCILLPSEDTPQMIDPLLFPLYNVTEANEKTRLFNARFSKLCLEQWVPVSLQSGLTSNDFADALAESRMVAAHVQAYGDRSGTSILDGLEKRSREALLLAFRGRAGNPRMPPANQEAPVSMGGADDAAAMLRAVEESRRRKGVAQEARKREKTSMLADLFEHTQVGLVLQPQLQSSCAASDFDFCESVRRASLRSGIVLPTHQELKERHEALAAFAAMQQSEHTTLDLESATHQHAAAWLLSHFFVEHGVVVAAPTATGNALSVPPRVERPNRCVTVGLRFKEFEDVMRFYSSPRNETVDMRTLLEASWTIIRSFNERFGSASGPIEPSTSMIALSTAQVRTVRSPSLVERCAFARAKRFADACQWRDMGDSSDERTNSTAGIGLHSQTDERFMKESVDPIPSPISTLPLVPADTEFDVYAMARWRLGRDFGTAVEQHTIRLVRQIT
jgi:hypothetical protein